jgi:hypothetical protein
MKPEHSQQKFAWRLPVASFVILPELGGDALDLALLPSRRRLLLRVGGAHDHLPPAVSRASAC